MTQNQEDAYELWDEAIEEDSTPAFEINTFEQFIEFIKVGVTALSEHKKLEKIEDITDEQKELIADIGLFITRYGSFSKWKNERKNLKSELAYTRNQLKNVSSEYKYTAELNAEIERRTREIELTKAEIEAHKKELENNNKKLQKEIERLSARIADQNEKMVELAQGDADSPEAMTEEQLNKLRNAKIDYMLELYAQKSEIEMLNLELDAIDRQRMDMNNVLVDYREYLKSIEDFNIRYEKVKEDHRELDKKRLRLEAQKNSEIEKLEAVEAEIETKHDDDRKIQDELRKFDLQIEKIAIDKVEKQKQYENIIADVEKQKMKIQDVFNEKGNLDETVSNLKKRSKDLELSITQIQSLLRLKINESKQLQSKIDDNLVSSNQIVILTETLQDVKTQIEQIKSQTADKEADKAEVDQKLAELTKNHSAFETRISETRRRIESANSDLMNIQEEMTKFEAKIDSIEIEKKTIIAENQDLLDELENITNRKHQIENKIKDLEADIENEKSVVSENNNKVIDIESERKSVLDKKFEFENRIIGIEQVLPKDVKKSEEAPMPFGTHWIEPSESESKSQEFEQFENYKKLTGLHFELSKILPQKLEFELRAREIEENLQRIEIDLTKIAEEKEDYSSDSELKNNMFDSDIAAVKQKIDELIEEITTNSSKKLELISNKEKLSASITEMQEDENEEDNPAIAQKRNELIELEKDIIDASEHIERLESFRIEMQEKLEEKIQQKNLYNAQNGILSRRSERLASKKEELETELQELKPKVSEINTEFNRVKSEISEAKNAYFGQTSEYERIIHQLRNQSEEIAVIDAEISKSEAEIKAINSEKEIVEQYKVAAIEEESKLADELRELKIREDVTEEDVSEVKDRLKRAENKVDKFDTELKTFTQKYEDVIGSIARNKEKKNKILNGRDDLEKRVNSFEVLMQTKENLMKMIRKEYEDELEVIDTLKHKINFLEVQIDNSTMLRKEINALNDQLREKIQQMKEKYDKLYNEYMNRDTVAKDLKVKYPIIEKELEKSRNTEKEAVTKLMRFEEQYSLNADKAKALELMKAALTKDINQLKQELELSQIEKSEIIAQNEETQAQFAQLEETIAELTDQLNAYKNMEKKFEDMKKRNEYLEAEQKKFRSLLGFEDIDITSELKQKLINNATLNLSARFLQKGWDYKNTLPQPDDIAADQEITQALNVLSKPLDAMKLRMNLRKFFEGIKNENPEKLQNYRTYFEKRTDEKPLTNSELKDVYSIAAHYVTLKEMLNELMKSLKISVP